MTGGGAPRWLTAGSTDIGFVRRRNEDSFAADDALGCYLVADGLGGHAAGDVASRVARDAVLNSLRGADIPSGVDRVAIFERADRTAILGRAVRGANAAVRYAARESPELTGMGSTLSVLWRAPGGAGFALAHVGDSRIYRLDAVGVPGLACITDDHSAAMEMVREGAMTLDEAENSALWNQLTRAVGLDEDVEVDAFDVDGSEAEAFLLCTDGLTGMIGDREIERILRDKSPDPRAACEALIGAAIGEGGHDNITVVVLYRTEGPAG